MPDIITLEISLDPTHTQRIADSNCYINDLWYEGRLNPEGQNIITQAFSGPFSNVPVQTSCDLELNDLDGGLDLSLATYQNWANKPIELFTWDGTTKTSRFKGIIRFPGGVMRNDKRVAITVDDLRSRDNKTLPLHKFTEANVVDKGDVGKPIPYLFGKYAFPLLIEPVWSIAAKDGHTFKISDLGLQAFDELYVKVQEVETKFMWELRSVSLIGGFIVAGGLHIISDKSLTAAMNGWMNMTDDASYYYALAKWKPASTIGSRVFRTADGYSWTDLGDVSATDTPLCIYWSIGANKLYASMTGTGGARLFYSTDDGANWTEDFTNGSNDPFPSDINCLHDFAGKLYAGCDNAIYRRDGDKNWVAIPFVGKAPFPLYTHNYVEELEVFQSALFMKIRSVNTAPPLTRYALTFYRTGGVVNIYTSASSLSNTLDWDNDWIGGLAASGEKLYYGKQNGGEYSLMSLDYWASSNPSIEDKTFPANITGGVYDTKRKCFYFGTARVASNGLGYLYKWDSEKTQYDTYALAAGDSIKSLYYYNRHVTWMVNNTSTPVWRLYCNSMISDDDNPLDVETMPHLACQGYPHGGALVEIPSDIIYEILVDFLGVDAGDIDSSFTTVKNILTNSGAGTFKVHRYLTDEVQAFDFIAELCSECGIMLSVPYDKYHLDYWKDNDIAGAHIYGGESGKEIDIGEDSFDCSYSDDYFNDLTVNYQHNPIGRLKAVSREPYQFSEYRKSIHKENLTAQGDDGLVRPQTLDCKWRYDDNDYIPVDTHAQNLIGFFSTHVLWVVAYIFDNWAEYIGGCCKIKMGSLSSAPMMIREIERDLNFRGATVRGYEISQL